MHASVGCTCITKSSDCKIRICLTLCQGVDTQCDVWLAVIFARFVCLKSSLTLAVNQCHVLFCCASKQVLPNTWMLAVFLAALCYRAGHYVFAQWFLLLSSSFFPLLISAVADWMSTILLHVV